VTTPSAWTVLVAGLGSAAAVFLVRRHARRRLLLDRPNDRSAHTEPTPRLGGLGIMVAFFPAAALWSGLTARGEALPVLGATAVVSLLGLVDDLHRLGASRRFLVQTAAAAAVVWLEREALAAAVLLPIPAWLLAPLAVLWIVWMTNLFNFMDGIDGLAAGQAILACLGLAAAAGGGDATVLLLLLAACCAGFLLFNFPPASIFMGDVGSTAIGFFLACVPFLPSARPIPAEVVWVATGLFILDATITLLRRVVRGERWYEAHRTHWYQRPLNHGISHRTITLIAWAGMAVLAVGAAAFPTAGWSGRAALTALPIVVLLPLAGLVRRQERATSAAEPGR